MRDKFFTRCIMSLPLSKNFFLLSWFPDLLNHLLHFCNFIYFYYFTYPLLWPTPSSPSPSTAWLLEAAFFYKLAGQHSVHLLPLHSLLLRFPISVSIIYNTLFLIKLGSFSSISSIAVPNINTLIIKNSRLLFFPTTCTYSNCLSNFKVHLFHLGILIKGRVGLRRSGVGFGILHFQVKSMQIWKQVFLWHLPLKVTKVLRRSLSNLLIQFILIPFSKTKSDSFLLSSKNKKTHKHPNLLLITEQLNIYINIQLTLHECMVLIYIFNSVSRSSFTLSFVFAVLYFSFIFITFLCLTLRMSFLSNYIGSKILRLSHNYWNDTSRDDLLFWYPMWYSHNLITNSFSFCKHYFK